MPKPKGKNQALFDATHQRVLACATELFCEFGYDDVSTKTLAEKAKVGQGSVFHHFKSKREMFITVHNQFQLRLIQHIDQEANLASSPEERFDRIWRAYLSATDAPAMRQILLLDGPKVIGLQALRAQDRETAFAFFMSEIEHLQNKKILQPFPIRSLAILLFGALDQAAFEIADFPDDQDLKSELIDSVAQLIDQLKI